MKLKDRVLINCCAWLCVTASVWAVSARAEDAVWGIAQSASGDQNLYLVDGRIKLTSMPAGTTNIAFKVAAAYVGRIRLEGEGGATVSFTPNEGGTTLTAVGTNSMFRLRGDVSWCFADGFSFVGLGEDTSDPMQPLPYDGAAIDCEGGGLTLSGATFANFVSRLTGGAVSARMLVRDMVVSGCEFAGNASGPINGYGGAIYVSADANAAGTVALRVTDSRFEGNYSQNGGAICTYHMCYEDETAVLLSVGEGTVFVGNVADYEGGAIFNEREMEVIGAQGNPIVFERNEAGFTGGAIAANDVTTYFEPAKLTVSNAVIFTENVASNDNEAVWKGGGAISAMVAGYELAVHAAAFSNNLAYASGDVALGGAVFTVDGVTNLFRKTAFVGNATASGPEAASFGGAVSVCGGETTVDNCVFDCRGTVATSCYGSAIDFDGVQGVVSNTTVRYGATEAISCVDSDLAIVNCVTLGNALQLGDGAADLLFEGSSTVSMSYTAYGTSATTETAVVTESCNLPDRVAEEVYDGDTLLLSALGFNPVAALGLVQSDVTDFVEVGYGTRPAGYSMGAYETPAPVVVLDVFGAKDYDSTTRSNGCVWTWKLTDTNGADIVCDDLVPTNLDAAAASAFLAERFAITNWVFGTEENGGAVGLYDSTNGFGTAWYLDGGVEPITDQARWIGALLKLRSHGEIKESWFILPVDFGNGETNGVYFTWGWIRENLDRCPTNDFEESCGMLRTPEENGYPRWQNYVMGVDGANSSNRIATTYAVRNPGAGGSVVDVVTPIASVAPPERVGVAAEYRLYNVTHTRRDILPDTSAQKWHCYATNDVPRFENFDLSKIHYGLKDLNRDYGQCLLEIYAIFKKGEKPEGAE